MDKLFGLPAHPFLVHIPVVLLPLAALGVVVMAIRPAWHERFRWAVLAIGAVGTIGIVLAASAGEELEGRIIGIEGQAAAAGWEHHAELGETARNVALVFFMLLTAFVVVPWWQERRRRRTGDAGANPTTTVRAGDRWLRVGLTALALLGAAASVVTVAQAGHSGSKSVWSDAVDTTP
jgi:hypothetical protein